MEARLNLDPELSDRARLLAAAVDGSTDMIAVSDLDGTVRFRNTAAVRALGAGTPGHGDHVRHYYDEETWSRIESEVLPALEDTGHWQGEAVVRNLDTGEPIHVDMTVFRVDDPETREPLGIATIQRDVTDRILARERDHIERLRGLARAAVVINSPLSVDEILEEISRQAGELIGADDVRIDLETPGTEAGAVSGDFDGTLSAPLVSRDGDPLGSIVLADKASGTFTEQDENILTQLAQMASVAIEKAHLYRLAAHEEAIRYREDMMAGVSHDMQTPLAAIVGLTDILAEGDDDLDESERTEVFQTLSRQAQNLHLQVQRFLDYSVLEADRDLLVHRRRIDVERVIERVVALFQHQREIIVGVSSGLPPAAGDGERLEQVLCNLVSNAIKYSDDAVRVVARPLGGRIVVDVVDEGRGMDDETVANLFRKFERGPNVDGTPGTGLGLYVSRALVEAQGGTLTVTSSPGIGSRFRVSLPRAGER